MSFLFEDDEPPASQEFICDNCGSNDCYYDAATGKDVCQNCFTQSQNINSQEVETFDFEEVMGLAAKTRKGMVIQRSLGHRKVSRKHPISELDKSAPLPTLAECMEGMKRVLKKSAEKLGELLDADIKANVQQLWVAYLRAYADAAQYYGERYPEVRFCLRDSFLPKGGPNPLKTMVLQHVAHRTAENIRNERKREREEEDTSGSPPSNKKPKPSKILSSMFAPRMNTEKLLSEHQRKGNRFGYKECALTLEPTMDFVAAMLWLVVCKSGVSSFQITQWIANHSIPLQLAYQCFLGKKWERKLEFVKLHFEMKEPTPPRQLEYLATLLATACRMKSKDSFVLIPQKNEFDLNGKPKDAIQFWSEESLPLVVARLVANAGLDQAVLDRTFALLGLPPLPVNSNHPSLPKCIPKNRRTVMTCTEDLLAVVALACQMDPSWRTRSFRRGESRSIPYNECQLATMTNRDFSKYLKFGLERYSNPAQSILWEGFDELETYPMHEFDRDDGKVVVKPCDIFSGARLSQEDIQRCQETVPIRYENPLGDNDARQTLLIDFLAYTAQAQATVIRTKMERYLVEIQQAESRTIEFLSFFNNTEHKMSKEEAHELLGEAENDTKGPEVTTRDDEGMEVIMRI